MNTAAIFSVLEKGLTLLPALISAGVSVIGTINKMQVVAEKAKNGEVVTEDEILDLDTDLDAKFAEFNAPLPPE